MVVTGTPQEAFLSHIPMFHPPHDVQLVVAGTFVPAAAGASLPSSFSDEAYTFLPDKFSLDALRTGTLRPGELPGTLFLGNFEAGGRPLPSPVRFVVSRVVVDRLLEEKSSQDELTYFVFGSSQRTFAAHRVAGSPGFDEVLRVQLGGDAPTDAELAKGVEAKLAEKDVMSSRLGLGKAPKAAKAGGKSFTIKPAAVLSCLEGPEFGPPCK